MHNIDSSEAGMPIGSIMEKLSFGYFELLMQKSGLNKFRVRNPGLKQSHGESGKVWSIDLSLVLRRKTCVYPCWLFAFIRMSSVELIRKNVIIDVLSWILEVISRTTPPWT